MIEDRSIEDMVTEGHRVEIYNNICLDVHGAGWQALRLRGF
jgi:hypothetical protein